ncbi:FAD dependent oxidoreductase [Arcticibacter tournemirensis]|uniref:FAD-dependent oxidoreductase n=1 Tax=Arcticibacter tournemirensis TaxID=699437 RepID=A0A5M9H6K0_9SPHI|nr:FAD-dependent oxidoreductase [Arcticibacter tournemirensis]KAA8481785.1 FAD-dependent oxidoreductase [Arcticibacter tournemirensis]TQM50180.1 FAD dependent oxidoreductase [Arcticibacter tournemirensis]
MKHTLFFLLLLFTFRAAAQPKIIQTDICVYGGTSAGVIAAYTAKKMNKSVLLIEPGKRLGGLSSGGLGFTDIGNKSIVTGVARDFYRQVGKHYGKFEQWVFEPKVAEAVFKEYVTKAALPVIYQKRVIKVKKTGQRIDEILLEDASGRGTKAMIVRAKMFIDCSYEGDLMARAGVSYTYGREANSQYNESINGVQMKNKHQFPDGIDPYKVPGMPESGLLWGVSAEPLAPEGSGDKKIQAYNFRICLTSDPANRVPVTRPVNYDSTKYELLLRYIEFAKPKEVAGSVLKFDHMPNRKVDINNQGPFSTDMIGMNYDYPDADYARRNIIFKAHETYNKGLLYFLGNDLRVPEHLRKDMLKWGYPKDEYTDNGHWTPQLYVREARRMVSDYVMTEANCLGKVETPDAVGAAAYTMDSHNAQRLVVNGMVKNEGDVQHKVPAPYPVSYRSIVPKAGECANLLVPVCLSASHIAYGSIRMEPVFMVLGQSAATAASMAIDTRKPVQKIDVSQLQALLKTKPLADNSPADILVDNDDKDYVEITGNWQKAGGGYGPSMLIDSTGSGAAIKFFPLIKSPGKYHVYTYITKVKGLASLINYTIYDGTNSKSVELDPRKVNVSGQTSGEWTSLGVFDLKEGKNAYIEISNHKKANENTIADAILIVPEH